MSRLDVRHARPRLRAAALLVAAPDRVQTLLLSLSIAVSVTVLLEAFRPLVVLPLTAVLVALLWRLVPDPVPATRRAVIGTSAALGVVLVWLAVNVPFAARFVVVTRDPGFLTLEGFWLRDNSSPDIPLGAGADLLAQIDGVRIASMAYSTSGDVVHVQGAKLLPGILAVGGWAGGDLGILVGNLVLGAVALLAVYAFARRLVGPLWALVPLVGMACSVPFAAFTRAAYTEPITVAFGFAGLTLAWSAVAARSWWQFAGAGAFIGATALARVDGAAQMIGLVAALGLAAACATLPAARRRLVVALAAATAGGLVLVALGYLDLAVHSPKYLSDLSARVNMLGLALAATVVVAVLVNVPLLARLLGWVTLRGRRLLAWGCAAAVVVVALVLVTRPLWTEKHNIDGASPYAGFIENIQKLDGLPLDGTRSYDELSVNWLTWYFGVPMVVLAFAGLAVATYRAVDRRDPRLLIFVGVVAAPSALYLWRVSITPDQVWAMRRFLPVTIPGFLVAATLALVVIWETRRRWARVLAVLGAVAVAGWPLLTWSNIFTVVEQDGRFGEATAACDAAAGRPVAVLETVIPYEATLRAICGTETVAVSNAEPETLARLREAWGGDVAVVAFHGEVIPWSDGVVPPPLRTTTETIWERTLVSPPQEARTTESRLWMGVIEPDGTVVPVPSGS
ncbi:ArnT family glycosyltransferase [Cellulosimicrobium sp. Marseille-Q8652]